MSDIELPKQVPFPGGPVSQVNRPSPSSDEKPEEQQTPDQKAQTTEKPAEINEKSAPHETAVIISNSLSSLEVGSRITASYEGIDGQDRPLISSDTGTYVVKYDPSLQPDVDKLPPHATLEVRILTLDREIGARIIYHDPAVKKSPTSTLSIPVTLEIIGLGSAPPKVRHSIDLPHLSHEDQRQAYQLSDIQRAGRVALDSGRKFDELPLPVRTTNYTLYEKAVPRADRPAIIRTSIVGTALIAQEQTIKSPAALQTGTTQVTKGGDASLPPGTPSVPSASLTENSTSPQEHAAPQNPPVAIDVAKLLHHDTRATVIKIIPQDNLVLPEIVQKHLGHSTPLENFRPGNSFNIRITSIAIPHPSPPDLPTETPQRPPANLNGSPPPRPMPPGTIRPWPRLKRSVFILPNPPRSFRASS